MTRHALERCNRVCDGVYLKNSLRAFNVTYYKCSFSAGCVEADITYRKLTKLEFHFSGMSNLVRERSPPSSFARENLTPARANPTVAPLSLYNIISMGHAKDPKIWTYFKIKFNWQ